MVSLMGYIYIKINLYHILVLFLIHNLHKKEECIGKVLYIFPHSVSTDGSSAFPGIQAICINFLRSLRNSEL